MSLHASPRPLRLSPIVAAATVLALATGTATARADDDCPAGSKYKTEGEFKWCEPTVCDSDAQCATGEVCRPVALCVQIGKVDTKPGQDAGQRLITTQRCGEDKACPSTTVCTEKSRCVSRAQADKMSGLTVKAAPSASAGGAGGEPAKKSCGCGVIGAHGGETFGLALGALGVALALARRGRRR
ncbi:MAG: hypothetical protein JST00_43190 [Deltaproteobacteria bacterium]|nr:hypothetical protein [Deltaproteobacteria bacterium]